MTNRRKAILTFAVFWPYFSLIFFLIMLASSPTDSPWSALLGWSWLLNMALDAAVLAIYIHDVRTNERIPQFAKTPWTLALFCGTPIVILLYWYLYIWRESARLDTSIEGK